MIILCSRRDTDGGLLMQVTSVRSFSFRLKIAKSVDGNLSEKQKQQSPPPKKELLSRNVMAGEKKSEPMGSERCEGSER